MCRTQTVNQNLFLLTVLRNKKREIVFSNHRVHEPGLSFCTFGSYELEYDKVSKSERAAINKLLFQVYDVYKPHFMTINCGHKEFVHWSLV